MNLLPHSVFWDQRTSTEDRTQSMRGILRHKTPFDLAQSLVFHIQQACPELSVQCWWSRDPAIAPDGYPHTPETVDFADLLAQDLIERAKIGGVLLPSDAGSGMGGLIHISETRRVWAIPLPLSRSGGAAAQLVMDGPWDRPGVEGLWGVVASDPAWMMVGAHFTVLIENAYIQSLAAEHESTEARYRMLLRLSETARTAVNTTCFLKTAWSILSMSANISRIDWLAIDNGENSLGGPYHQYQHFLRTTVARDPLLNGDEVHSDPHKIEQECLNTKTAAYELVQRDGHGIWMISVPGMMSDGLVGCLTIERADVRYSDDERELFEFVAYCMADSLMHWADAQRLERMVQERTLQLQISRDALLHEIEERKRGEQLQTCLFDIASLATDTHQWPTFYDHVRTRLGSLMNAENFYVALLNPERNWIEFPYFQDEFHSQFADRAVGHGLTEYLLSTGEPVCLTSDDIEALAVQGCITRGSPKSSSWIGAPLTNNDGQAFGVVVVQSYHPEVCYTKKDLDILIFVAQQMANGIIRNRALADIHEANALLEMRVSQRTEDLRKEILERKKIEDRLTYEASHDNLTGLPNRKFLQERLTNAMNSDEACGLLFIDIDRFKGINDTMGHAVGDGVLKEFSNRLLHNLRPHDFVARLSGDEFVVLMLRDTTEQMVEALSYRLLEAMREPMLVDGNQIVVSCSIGWFMAEASDRSPERPDLLLRNADMALYQAKRKGRQRVERFSRDQHKQMVDDLAIEQDLRGAVIANDFEPAYQPIVDLASGLEVGYEALARWRHQTRGTMYPGSFLALAERNGLIEQIDWCIYDKAMAWGALYLSKEQYISINVSARHFVPQIFVSKMIEKITEYGLAVGQVHIELNESTLFENSNEVLAVIEELKRAGFHLAIDDFGTGFSSLSYLLKFPIDSIKIDQSFVIGLGQRDDRAGREIVAAIIAMGRALGIDVVAEGVETEDARGELLRMDCRLGQGYLFVNKPTGHVDRAQKNDGLAQIA